MAQNKNNVVVIVIILAVILLYSSGNLNIGKQEPTQGGEDETPVVVGCDKDTTIVTFNHVDFFSESTIVEQGARILGFNNDKNIVIANAGTKHYAPEQSYKVLLGNQTTNLTANTGYYPQYVEGTLECIGATTLQGKLYKTTQQTDLPFSFKNTADAVNTAQAMSASSDYLVRVRVQAADDECFGNPYAADMGGKNVMCFTYNDTTYNYLELLNEKIATTPQTAIAVNGKNTICYEWSVVCDGNAYENKLLIQTTATQPTGATHNISVSLHDVNFDYDATTLDLIVGVEDESKTRNDLGIEDINTGNSFDYSISVT